MPAPSRLASLGRTIRILRLAAAFAVIAGLAAVALIVRDGPADLSQLLIGASIFLGSAALVGMALAAWPYRRKDKNDPRP